MRFFSWIMLVVSAIVLATRMATAEPVVGADPGDANPYGIQLQPK